MDAIATQQSWFETLAPEMAKQWKQFHDSVYESGELDSKSKELIAAAASTVGRCPHCTKGHIQKAKKQGATKQEIAETFMITSLISSGTELHWMLDDYEELLGNSSAGERWFQEQTEQMGAQWRTFHDALYEESALDRKTKELVAIAVAETRRCRHCTIAHIKGAQKTRGHQKGNCRSHYGCFPYRQWHPTGLDERGLRAPVGRSK